MSDTLPSFEDTTDFADADRGFLGALVPGVVTAEDGRVIWDNDAYAFLKGDCPDTAHPSLWRQGQLCARQASTRSPRASSRSAAWTSPT